MTDTTVARSAALGGAASSAADLGLRRGRRARARPHRAAPARRRAPLRGDARLGRAPARRARGEGPAPRLCERPGARCAISPTRRSCSSGSRIRSSCARFGAVLDGRFPHLVLEHLEGPTLDELIDARRRAGARAGAAARAARRLRAALPGRRGRRPPRRQAEQHRDGRPAAADRPQRRADARRGARPCARRSAPTPTWRPSSARPTAGSARRPTSGGWPRRCYTALTGATWRAVDAARGRRAARAAPPPHTRARSPTSSAPASTPTRPPAPPPREFAAALEPLVAALPRRLTLGRRS